MHLRVFTCCPRQRGASTGRRAPCRVWMTRAARPAPWCLWNC